MRGRVTVWIAVGILFVLHFFLHVGLGLGRIAPDLLTVGLLLAAREAEMGEAAGLGLVFGLFEDALSVLSFGANAVAMTFVAILGSATRDLFVGDSAVFLVTYLVVGKLFRDFVHWVMVGSTLRDPFVEQVLVQGGLAAVYAAAFGVATMALIGLRTEVPR